MKWLLLAFAIGTLATQTNAVSKPEPLLVLAPYLPATSEQGPAGRDIEIFAAVMDRCEIDVHFHFYPFKRHLRNFTHEGLGDAVMTVPPGMDTPGFESTPYVYYQNGAAVLESTNIKPYHLRYLKGLRVVSFAGASQLLGIESHIESFASYSEFADQRIHSRMLFLNRVDVVLADGLIFAEINHRLRADRTYADKADLHQKVMFIPIFAPTPYRASFRKKEHRDAFNACFSELEAEGVVRAINVRHIEKYRDTVGYGYLGY